MKVVIITGGTGSKAIQDGYSHYFQLHSNKSDLSLLVNGYDDGKSTGVVRKVFNGEMLGPSDFRKNILNQYSIRNGKDDTYQFLEKRITYSCDIIEQKIQDLLEKVETGRLKSVEVKQQVLNWIHLFLRRASKQITDYHDFSIGNIILGGMFDEYCCMKKTVMEFESLLGLPHQVIISSLGSYILKGNSMSGKILQNEETVVSWSNITDPIDSVFFTDWNGINVIPELEPDAYHKILEAEIIIISTGTMWSSLIPTMITKGFREAFERSRAKKYWILNLSEDYDVFGLSALDYYNILAKYICLTNVSVMFSVEGPDNLHLKPEQVSSKIIPMKNSIQIGTHYHNGRVIWKYILEDFFPFLKNPKIHYYFDYDDTLFNKDHHDISLQNLELLQKVSIHKTIITGNDFNNVKCPKNTELYSNFGYYHNKQGVTVDITRFEEHYQKIFELLQEKFPGKVENRRGISFCIKPIDNRKHHINELKTLLGQDVNCYLTGRTSIECSLLKLDKGHVFERETADFVYFSDIYDVDTYKHKTYIVDIFRMNTILYILEKIYRQDMIVIAGGINARMCVDYPKSLVSIFGKPNIEHLIANALQHVGNLWIITNEKFASFYWKYKGDRVNILVVKAGDGSIIPRGNGETCYEGLKMIMEELTHDIIISWSDVYIRLESELLKEIQEVDDSYETFGILPVRDESLPYAHFEVDGHFIKDIQFTKKERGYHDMSVFRFNRDKLYKVLNQSIHEHDFKKNGEFALLNVLKFGYNSGNPCVWYQTQYPTFSYNTWDEIDTFEKNNSF